MRELKLAHPLSLPRLSFLAQPCLQILVQLPEVNLRPGLGPPNHGDLALTLHLVGRVPYLHHGPQSHSLSPLANFRVELQQSQAAVQVQRGLGGLLYPLSNSNWVQ